jgi:hypothetical protein
MITMRVKDTFAYNWRLLCDFLGIDKEDYLNYPNETIYVPVEYAQAIGVNV